MTVTYEVNVANQRTNQCRGKEPTINFETCEKISIDASIDLTYLFLDNIKKINFLQYNQAYKMQYDFYVLDYNILFACVTNGSYQCNIKININT